MADTRRRVWLLLVVAALLPYANVFQNGWTYYDDYAIVVDRAYVRTWTPEHLRIIWTPRNNYAPVRDMAYLAVHTVAGRGIAGFQAVNLAWHAVGVLALYAFVRRQWGDEQVAVASALLFAAHPIHVEAVAWVMGTKDVLCFAFSTLACVAYGNAMRDERAGVRPWIATGVLLLLALGAKLAALGLPLVFAALEVCAPDASAAPWRRRLRRWLPFAVLTGVWLLVAAAPLRTRAFDLLGVEPPAAMQAVQTAITQATDAGRAETYWPTIRAMGPVTWRYAALWAWPRNLSALYPVLLEPSWLQPRVLFAYLGLLAAAGGGVVLWRRGHRRAAFWFAWAAAFYLPVSNIMPVTAVMNDRYVHLPAAAGSVLLAAGLVHVGKRGPGWGAAARGVLVGLVLALSVATVARTAVWRSPRSLWEDAARTDPDSVRIKITLAGMLVLEGRAGEAAARLRALEADAPNDYRRLLLLGRAEAASARYTMAARTYEQGLRGFPGDVKMLAGLAAVRAEAGDYEAVRRHLEAIFAQQPNHGPAHRLAGLVFAEEGRVPEAVAAFERAVAYGPDDPAIYAAAAQALEKAGAPREALPYAREWYRRAENLDAALLYTRVMSAAKELPNGIKVELEIIMQKWPDNSELQNYYKAIEDPATAAGPAP